LHTRVQRMYCTQGFKECIAHKGSKNVLYTRVQSGDTVTTLSKEQAASLCMTNTVINIIQVTLQSAPSQCTDICSTESGILLLES